MKAIEVVRHLKEENPGMLANIPDRKAAAIIRNALSQLGKHIDETSEGIIKVQGLGKFRIRQVEREKDGQKKTVKRINFRPIIAKSKDERDDAN